MPSFIGVLSNRLFQIDGLLLKQMRELHLAAPPKNCRAGSASTIYDAAGGWINASLRGLLSCSL